MQACVCSTSFTHFSPAGTATSARTSSSPARGMQQRCGWHRSRTGSNGGGAAPTLAPPARRSSSSRSSSTTATLAALPPVGEVAAVAAAAEHTVQVVAALADAAATTAPPATTMTLSGEPDQFAPQLNDGILVAALVAAAPPIIFWSRIFLNAQRRVREDEEKERQREELKRKITGSGG